MNPFDAPNDFETVIHVRSLGQYEYCPRAGVLAFESQVSQPESDDDPVPNLGFSPPMELAKLDELIADRQQQLLISLPLAAVAFTFAVVVSNISDPNYALMMWLAFALSFAAAIADWQNLAVLREEHRRFRRASDRPFHTGLRHKCHVDWWQLVKVYEPKLVQAPYSDRGLVGRPWRILGFDGSRFPVIRSGADEFEIKSAHRVKLAAYALLIEELEGCTSDWGVVIFRSTRTGIAVPLTQQEKSKANLLLNEFRATIAQGLAAAGHPNACAKCPFNRRRLYREGKSETRVGVRTLHPYLPRGETTHCDCGDRFGWTPPKG